MMRHQQHFGGDHGLHEGLVGRVHDRGVQSGSQRSGGLRGGAGTGVTLTPEDAQAIARECPVVAAVSPDVNVNVSSPIASSRGPSRNLCRRFVRSLIRDAANGDPNPHASRVSFYFCWACCVCATHLRRQTGKRYFATFSPLAEGRIPPRHLI